MAITAAICTSFKKELALGVHDFTITTGDVFKLALFTSSATLGASTTAYSTSNEVVGTGYTAGGKTLANITPLTSGTTAYWGFSNISWTTATITARGALLYNSSESDKAVAVFDFGSDISSTAGTFAINFPTNDATTGTLRLA